MRTHMECRSLGESKSNYTTHESVRQIRQHGARSNMKKAKSSRDGGSGALALGLLAGAAAGALAGVLLAPEKGTTLRRKVSDQASRLGEQVNKGYSTTRSKVTDWTSKGKGSRSDSQAAGNVQRSPYTDPTKWEDMGNDRNTPAI